MGKGKRLILSTILWTPEVNSFAPYCSFRPSMSILLRPASSRDSNNIDQFLCSVLSPHKWKGFITIILGRHLGILCRANWFSWYWKGRRNWYKLIKTIEILNWGELRGKYVSERVQWQIVTYSSGLFWRYAIFL